MTDKQGEQKDILGKDEIPPDTQINSEHHENIENEVNENNQNRIINQNQSNEEQLQGGEEEQVQVGEDMQREEQMQGEEEDNMQEAEDQEQAEEEAQIQEGGDQVQDNDEQVQEGGEEVQDNDEQAQEGGEEVQDNDEQIQEGGEQADVGQQANLEGRQYQFVQNGQLYQVDQNGQMYRINQEMQAEEMQHLQQLQQLQNQEMLKGEQYQYQNNLTEGRQIAQPIYQSIQQNQAIQGMQGYGQNQIMQGYGQNQIMQGYEQNQIMQGYQQNQIMQGMQGYQQNQRIQYYQNQSFEPNQDNAYSNENAANYQYRNEQQIVKTQQSRGKKQVGQESKQKMRESKGMRKEPKDSNPKIHLAANKAEHKNILRNLSNTKIYNNSTQKFSFVINSNDKQTLKPSQSILFKNLNEINKLELKEKIADFVEIPRKDYDNYEGKEIIVINDGMDTGEYKFIGEQTTLQEKYPKEKGTITQEEINQEIGRRYKIRKQKKVSYEIIDKFYTVTDVRTKTIKKIDNNTSKKNEFYSTLETNIKNANISNNKKNDNLKMKSNFESNYQGVGSARYYQSGDNVEGNYNLNKGNAKSVYYQSGGNAEENYYQSRGNAKGVYYQSGANPEAQYYQSGNTKGIYYQSGGKNEGNYFQSGGGSSRGIYSHGSGKGGYYHNSENIISDYYQNKGSNYKSDNNYSEFRKEVPMIRNNSNFNYINSILSIPTDNYSKYLLEQINKIRTEPQSFIGVIEDAKANIKKDRYGRLIYDGKMKIALGQGEAAFNDAIKFLKKLDPMEALEYSSLLTVVPPKNQEEIKDKEDLNKKIEEMIKDGTDIKSYWRDVIKDPEISFLLMIVDDNGTKSGKRRRDILDPYMKYIGISSAEINKSFACYITLSS